MKYSYFFPNLGLFGTIRKPDSEYESKILIFVLITNCYLTKAGEILTVFNTGFILLL